MPRIQLKNKPSDLAERTERLRNLCHYNEAALNAMTVNELRELVAYLQPNARKLRKPELIAAILELAEPFKAEMLARNAQTLELMGKIELNVPTLANMFDSGVDAGTVGQFVVDKVKSGNFAPSTIAKTKTKQLRVILDTIAFKNPTATEWGKDVYHIFCKYAENYHTSVNNEYAAKVETYGTEECVSRIDGRKVVEWAKDTIDWAYEQSDLDRGWHKVSLALAIASGRRMDEIHGHTQYEVGDSQTLRAIGLSKKKDDDYVLESPCLVDANKWVVVLYKLPESRRNRENSVVHGVIRPKINESGGKYIKELGFKSYKDSRDFYVNYLIATAYNRSKHGSEINFAKALIGHDSKHNTLSYQKMIVNVD